MAYNNAGEIAACLQSLPPAAPHARLHVTVIDNASTDNTRIELQRLQQEMAAVWPDRIALEVIGNAHNAGFTAAVNQGLARVAADDVLFLNPDTVLPPDSLDQLCRLLAPEQGVGCVAPQLRYPDGTVQPSCRRFPTHRDVFFAMLGLNTLFPRSRLFNGWKMGDFDHRQRRFVEQPQGACLLTTARVAREVGHWDDRFRMFFSDVDWCRRLRERGYQILFVPEIRVMHRQGSSIYKSRLKMIFSSHRSFILYFLKYYRGWRWLLPNFTVIALLVAGAPVRCLLEFLGSLVRSGRKSGAPCRPGDPLR